MKLHAMVILMIELLLTILQEDINDARRELFWPGRGVSYADQIGFLIYFGSAIVVVLILLGILRHMRIWFHGKYDREEQGFLSFFVGLINRTLRNIFSRSFPTRLSYSLGAGIKNRQTKKKGSFLAHTLMMWGFIGSAIATTILTIHEYIFHEELLVGWLYLIYSFGADMAGVILVVGTIMAFVRRYITDRDYYVDTGFEDIFLLALLFWVGVSGFLMEAARITYGFINTPDLVKYEIFSVTGWLIAQLLFILVAASNDPNFLILGFHLIIYLTHLATVFTLLVYVVLSKFLHIGVGVANIALKDLGQPRGQLNFGEEGLSKIEDFSFYQLLESSACMKCHFCHNYCPAQDTGEPLSPMKVIQDVVAWGKKQYTLLGGKKDVSMLGDVPDKSGITKDVLWACVTCYACVEACPVLIGHVDMIVGMRASLLESGDIPATFTTMLESVYQNGNVWNQPKRERTKWLKDASLPRIKKSESKLLWLPGDTLAYDPRNQKVARATYDIFSKIDLDYGTFGDAEKSDGNEIRRLGEEALFRMLAEENIKMFQKRDVQRIVCSSPHAYNTIKNEYPAFGGVFDVVHITQFLWELIQVGKIEFTKELNYDVTFHDPCYLGRYNGVFDEPRKIIERLPGVIISKEMPNHKQFSYCCGGGGGGMFRETPKWVETRISERRVMEAKETFDSMAVSDRKKILITACPFCTSMLVDATKTRQLEDEIEVKDIVELVSEAMGL